MFGWWTTAEPAEERHKRLILIKKLADLKELEDLRDQFAGQALTGICANEETDNVSCSRRPETMARIAYEYADAMIEARKSKAGRDG